MTIAGYHPNTDGPSSSVPPSLTTLSPPILPTSTPPTPITAYKQALQSPEYHTITSVAAAPTNNGYKGDSHRSEKNGVVMNQYGPNYQQNTGEGQGDPAFIYPSTGPPSPIHNRSIAFLNNNPRPETTRSTDGPHHHQRISDPSALGMTTTSPHHFAYTLPAVDRTYQSFSNPVIDNRGYPHPPAPNMPWSSPMQIQPGLGGENAMAVTDGQVGQYGQSFGEPSGYNSPLRYPEQPGGTGGSGSSESGRLGFHPIKLEGEDDNDNRTRNAKAQKRHREKRKAHVKNLEESVTVLQQEMRMIRNGVHPEYVPVGSGNQYPSDGNTQPLIAQNDYLRKENQRLRRDVETLQRRLQEVEALQPSSPIHGRSDGPTSGGPSSAPIQGSYNYDHRGNHSDKASYNPSGLPNSHMSPPTSAPTLGTTTSEMNRNQHINPYTQHTILPTPSSGISSGASSEYYTSGDQLANHNSFLAYQQTHPAQQNQMYQMPDPSRR